MAVKLVQSLTHFQGGFQSHSSQGCNTEEKQDAVTKKVYSQQGGAPWASFWDVGKNCMEKLKQLLTAAD